MKTLARISLHLACVLLVSPSTLTKAQTLELEKRITPVAAAERQSFDHQPRVALLVGVTHDPHLSALTQLSYPSHNVDLIDAELARQGYKVVSLKDQDATRGSIKQALRNVSKLVDRGSGTVLFFFSGHLLADHGENFLATYEASTADLPTSGIALKEIQDLLKDTGAPRQIIFIESSRNEGSNGAGARSFPFFQIATGLRLLFSTKASQLSYEDATFGSGVFTHFLVDGLKGQAAGHDGLITFRDLADFVTISVRSYALAHGQTQVPAEFGGAGGDFLVAVGAQARSHDR